MKKFLLIGTLAVLLIGCSVSPPSVQPESAPAPATTTGGSPREQDQRLAFFCTSLDNSPDVQLSSLEEVWAASNYLRMESCDVTYVGPQPFQPTPDEAAAIEIANSGSTNASDGLEAYLTAVELCTRVSDETAPGGFAERPKEILLAAARICPDGPQGKIIQGWANGTRIGDGRHVVGDSMEPGKYRLEKKMTAPEGECTWAVAGADGSVIDQNGSLSEQVELTLENRVVLTSDKCGIWEKID
ncbi:hypothetical protein F8G81_15675 [Arthrobacter sp. CDRTa11]|uniref:hypothetical protein n=1 Tax=Arthrobacter sp. CDRTa11 TaxID=2651199 RepID=UPI0022658F09|nr:hypothetical protein [Arthrobacter sp. CDRTa11]UZX03884.1 hypothetical protein F8G81_15675 [Arthrobacter sp. CDRTa11]